MAAPEKRWLLGSLVVRGHQANNAFEIGQGQQGGRWYLPYPELKAAFDQLGIELNTRDVNQGRTVDFELHVNARRTIPGIPSYLYAYEDPLVKPKHGNRKVLQKYRKVFTSNQQLIDHDRFIPLDFPNRLSVTCFTPIAERQHHCVLMAANKALLQPHPRNLHWMRLEAIRHMERHYAEQFTLWGPGWDKPAVKPGVLGRAIKRLQKWKNRIITPPVYFPNWRGTVYDKAQVLNDAKLSIVIENVRGSPGYLTEKIFDSMISGCIPIFCGNEEAHKVIPPECMINIDNFPGVGAAIDFAMNLSDDELQRYQNHIRNFVNSPAVRRFDNEHFIKTIVDTIVSDLHICTKAAENA